MADATVKRSAIAVVFMVVKGTTRNDGLSAATWVNVRDAMELERLADGPKGPGEIVQLMIHSVTYRIEAH